MKLRSLRIAAWSLLAFAAACAQMARAHEFKLDAVLNAFVKIEPGEAQLVVRGPLYLFRSAKFPISNNILIDVDKSGPAIERSLAAIAQSVTLFENGRPLVASRASGRLSLPSDRSFESYEQAASHVSEPPEPDTSIYIDQGYVDARITYPISSPGSVFAIRTPSAAGLGDLKVSLRYMPLGEDSRAMVFTSLSGIVVLNPTWVSAAAGFIGLGIEHILTGYDHLLFLLCLVIPLRGWRQILSVITIFTVAHSFTLLGSAFNLAPSGAWFPPFVETAIAASIVYMALENIMGVNLERRVLITGLFGLVHGFGFSYGLQENFQYAGTHLLVSLFAFNIGIEMGQIVVLAVMLPALVVVRRYVLTGHVGMIILSAIVAQTGWQWMIERGGVLMKVQWPRPSLAGLAVLALWVAGLLLAAGGIRAIARRLRFTAGSVAPPPQRSAAD
jgi:HupE / UreJ protein